MSKRFPNWRPLIGILLCPCIAILISGCWNSGVETVGVRGRVKFNGGPCPTPGGVFFTPISTPGDLPARPASGQFKEDGEFVISSFKEGDGLVPGTYRVRIVCWRVPPDPVVGGGVSFVPASYKPPDLVIESGTRSTVEVEYDIPNR